MGPFRPINESMALVELASGRAGGTLASREAELRRVASLSALRLTQPWIAERLPVPDDSLEWLFGRDGTLSARCSVTGRWLGNCSLPRRASERMLRDMEVSASVACLLAPIHAAMVRVVADRLRRDQALLVIVPDDAELAVLLSCEDFSDAMRAHRLWFAGAPIADDIEQLYARHIGLPVPGQFVRASTTAHEVEPLIQVAQGAFSRVVAAVPERLAAIRAGGRVGSGRGRRVCVVAPSGFRLWRDTTPPLLHALAETDGKLTGLPVDTDIPTRSAPIALALASADAAAVLSADLGRGDIPGMVDESKPWISWITSRRVPARVATAVGDRLILCDPTLVPLARKAGWTADHLHVAGWPDLEEISAVPSAVEEPEPGGPYLLLLADLPTTAVPAEVDQFSSHRVLWEAIQRELRTNPTALAVRPEDYLGDRASRLGIDVRQLASRRFLDQCIPSGFAIGVASLLVDAGLPLRVGGVGWEQAELPRQVLLGPVVNRQHFASLVRDAAALVSVFTDDATSHPIHACGKAVLHAHGRDRARLLSDANALRSGQVPPLPLRGRRISGPLLLELYGG